MQSILLLTLLIFVVTLGFAVSGIYFWIETPGRRRQIRARVKAAQQAVMHWPDKGASLYRHEVMSNIPFVHRLLIRVPFAVRLQLRLQQAAVGMSVGMLLLVSLSLGVAVATIGMLTRAAVVLPLAALAFGFPFMVISWKRTRRFGKFEEQFPDAMDLMARAVRAGHAFPTALELIATELPEPVAGEFRTAYEHQNFGLLMREALNNLAVRVPLPDVRIFVTALQIQRETGGNLAEILDNLSAVVRERFKIKRQVQVHTAEGRLSLYSLTAIPPIVGLLMFLVNPEYMKPLFFDPLGQKALAAAVSLQCVGYLVISRIIRIKV